MKKRILLGVLMLALMVGVPAAVAAQSKNTTWDLTEKLTFTDLGFNFNYPAGWDYKATPSSGVFFAENKSDLDAVTDGDNKTLADGSTIQMIGTKVSQLASALGTDDPTLEQIADFVVESRGITEKEDRIDVPVMTRRTLAVFGADRAKQGWILTIWRQGDFVIGAFMTSPSYDEVVQLAGSWGALLTSIKPNDALALSKNTMPLAKVGAEFNYPQGWYPNPKNANLVYELKSDLQDSASEGMLLAGVEQTLADMQLKKNATIDDVVASNIESLALVGTVRREEFILFGQPAVTIRGTNGSGQFALLTQVILKGIVVQIGAISPDEAAIDTFEPTFIAMLQSLQATKTK